jgi:hypothetical protein
MQISCAQPLYCNQQECHVPFSLQVVATFAQKSLRAALRGLGTHTHARAHHCTAASRVRRGLLNGRGGGEKCVIDHCTTQSITQFLLQRFSV